MELNYESIAALNRELPRVDVKGKGYSLVASRVQAFRKLIPMGSISTEVIRLDGDMVVMRAVISDETGRVLATGTAFERQGSSFINKTSYIENCETSAVGRALGILGIGSEEQMCSADELVNAINNQSGSGTAREIGATRSEILKIVNQYPERELSRKICERYKVNRVTELSAEDALRCLKDLRRTVKDFEVA